MRITRVSIENFRCFDRFAIDLAGESRLLVGENAIGKSSLITGIARALGRERGFQRKDFLDLARGIDIRVTLTGLDTSQLGIFAEAADFGATTSLTVGVMVAWDPDAEESDVTHGYPTKAWKQSNRIEREAPLTSTGLQIRAILHGFSNSARVAACWLTCYRKSIWSTLSQRRLKG